MNRKANINDNLKMNKSSVLENWFCAAPTYVCFYLKSVYTYSFDVTLIVCVSLPLSLPTGVVSMLLCELPLGIEHFWGKPILEPTLPCEGWKIHLIMANLIQEGNFN